MKNFILLFVISLSLTCFAQVRNKASFVEKKNAFYEKMSKEVEDYNNTDTVKEKSFKVDFSGMEFPTDMSLYKTFWHNTPLNQGITGTCWCFSTVSFLESEIYRLTKQQVKLSEMYTVYWEYVEKAIRFIRERGDSNFDEGSEADAVTRMWAKYGTVPAEAFTGKKPGQKHHDHSKLIKEMKDYLNFVKASNAWDEERAVAVIKSILNHYLGEPPAKINVDGKEITPLEYMKNVLKVNTDDYVSILSLMEKPFNQKVEYVVPDNWWHSEEYYNVPLDLYMKMLKSAIRNGYTIALGGDVSEPGYDSNVEVGIIPTFDIPSEYIDDYARQFRFSNQTTQDDHGIHLVGYMEQDGKDWYVIKDSGAGGMNGKNIGYYFYHEDYVKLKIVDFMVHKDAVKGFINLL